MKLHSVLVAFLVFPLDGFAQVTGTISGMVEDPSRAAVSGATITVKSLDTGSLRATTTDDSGRFRLPALPLGPQEIHVEKRGFKRTNRTGLNLIIGQDLVVNLKLELGEFSQQITLSADAPLVNTTTAEVSGFVGERAVKDLPLNGRSWDNLVALNPSAVNFTLKSPNTPTTKGNAFAVAGRPSLDNLVLLNGIEYTGVSFVGVTPGGVSGGLLGINAVREFNFLSDTYS